MISSRLSVQKATQKKKKSVIMTESRLNFDCNSQLHSIGQSRLGNPILHETFFEKFQLCYNPSVPHELSVSLTKFL